MLVILSSHLPHGNTEAAQYVHPTIDSVTVSLFVFVFVFVFIFVFVFVFVFVYVYLYLYLEHRWTQCSVTVFLFVNKYYLTPDLTIRHKEQIKMRSQFVAIFSAHSVYFNVSRQKVPYFNVLREKIP